VFDPRRLLIALGVLLLSWYGMMAVHELGHVAAAWASGGGVEAVTVPLLGFSRTDVSPNPAPGVVVWAGPVLGSVLPLGLALVLRRPPWLRGGLMFFAGFCFVANGAYLAAGVWDRVGDCGVMLETGSSRGVVFAVGMAMAVAGFILWHRLGSLRSFLQRPRAAPRPAPPH